MRQSMAYIPQTPDKETRIELIKTLQTVTEGKVSCILRAPQTLHPLLQRELCHACRLCVGMANLHHLM